MFQGISYTIMHQWQAYSYIVGLLKPVFAFVFYKDTCIV